MKQVSIFLKSFYRISTWKTIFITLFTFYFLGVTLLRFDVLISLFKNLGFTQAIFPISSLYANPLDTFSPLSLVLFLSTATLFGLHIVALRLYVTKRFYTKGQHFSLFGVMSSLLGCLACCGSVLISTITAILGVSLSHLPFNGEEIGFVGLIISLGALTYTVGKIDAPMTC